MSRFSDADEVYATIGRLFVELIDDRDLVARFRQADTVLQYRFTDPESTITLNLLEDGEDRVDMGETDMAPEVVMSMSADTAHSFWLGELSMTAALARGQMKASGPVVKLLKLVHLTRPIHARYRALLEEAGRTDLEGAPS